MNRLAPTKAARIGTGAGDVAEMKMLRSSVNVTSLNKIKKMIVLEGILRKTFLRQIERVQNGKVWSCSEERCRAHRQENAKDGTTSKRKMERPKEKGIWKEFRNL